MSLHPLEIKIDNEVAEALKRANVTYLFGIPGGGTSIDLIESCNEVGIPFVLVQHETSAAIMAVVCAELTNSCGACISIMGPGAINLASGAGYAFWERHPLLCFTESYGLAKAPKMSIQRMDHAQMFSAFSKGSVILSNNDPGKQIDDSISLAISERPGPVHVDFPMDTSVNPEVNSEYIPTEVKTFNGDLDAIANAIKNAKKPLLVVGPVVQRVGANDQLLALAEKLQVAVMVTSKARGVISEDNPLFVGIMSGVYQADTFEGRIVDQSDLVLAVGLDRMELLSPWSYTQPLIALDSIDVPADETVGTPLFTASGPIGDMLEYIENTSQQRKCWDVSAIEDFWNDAMKTLRATDSTLNAASLLHHARKIAPEDAIVSTEAGVYGRVNLYVWKVYDSETYFDSSGANTMGYSIPAALASSLVRPSQKSIALVGDAGFLMRVSELETAARLKLSPVIIIFDDGTLGMIRIKQRAKEYAREGVDLAQTDFVRLAQSFGGIGWEVRTLEEFDTAFEKALSSDKLTVIDARLDPDVYASHIRYIRGY